MMKSFTASLVAMALATVIVGGCCGRTTKVEVQPTSTETTTPGQQLIDLQKAYDTGCITKEQYDKLKQDIIEKSGK